MQKVVAIVILCIVICGAIVCFGFTNENGQDDELFRIHIIANSNDLQDSEIKYVIKDAYSNFLTPLLASCNSVGEARQIVKSNLEVLKAVADDCLENHKKTYKSAVCIKREYFPKRLYGEFTANSGDYDGVVVTLGDGKGDNWWCVLFPPLCYYNDGGAKNVVYKSKLLEIIKKLCKNA